MNDTNKFIDVVLNIQKLIHEMYSDVVTMFIFKKYKSEKIIYDKLIKELEVQDRIQSLLSDNKIEHDGPIYIKIMQLLTASKTIIDGAKTFKQKSAKKYEEKSNKILNMENLNKEFFDKRLSLSDTIGGLDLCYYKLYEAYLTKKYEVSLVTISNEKIDTGISELIYHYKKENKLRLDVAKLHMCKVIHKYLHDN